MRILDIHPAWGFDSRDRLKVALNQRDEQIREGKFQNNFQPHHRLHLEARMIVNNLSKVIGFFPILNVIVGIGRIILAATDNTKEPVKKAINQRHIVRGCAEIFFGPFLIFADIWQTHRDIKVVEKYQIRYCTV